MNNKTKNWAMSILGTVIVLICFAIYLMFSIIKGQQTSKKTERESNYNFVYSGDIVLDITHHSKIEKADKDYEFHDTERCIQTFISTLGRIDKSIYVYEDEESVNNKVIDNKQQLYSMLDEEYIYNYNLTIDNMDERFSYFYNTLQFLTENMYVLDDENTHESLYFVYGDLVNVNKNTIQQYGFIVRRYPRNRIIIYNNSL